MGRVRPCSPRFRRSAGRHSTFSDRLLDTPPLWAEWQYDHAEWEEFNTIEFTKSKRESSQSLWVYILGAIAFSFVGLPFNTRYPGSLYMGLFMGGFVLFFTAGAYLVRYLEAVRRYKARLKGPCTVRITPVGIYESDTYIPLVSRERKLLWVSVSQQNPKILCFSLMLGRGPRKQIRILVPHGYEAEANSVVDLFRREVLHG